MENYDTLTEAITALKKQGYSEDFNLKPDFLECQNKEFNIFHNEFQIDKSFRFDVDEDPSDQAVLYAISSEKYALKGLLVNGYGLYSELMTDEMLKKFI